MGAGRFHDTAEYRRQMREGKESFKILLGIIALPFLIIYFPLKWIFGSRKKK